MRVTPSSARPSTTTQSIVWALTHVLVCLTLWVDPLQRTFVPALWGVTLALDVWFAGVGICTAWRGDVKLGVALVAALVLETLADGWVQLSTSLLGAATFLRALRCLCWRRSSGLRPPCSPQQRRCATLLLALVTFTHLLACWLDAMASASSDAVFLPEEYSQENTLWGRYSLAFATVFRFLKAGCPVGGGGTLERVYELVVNFASLILLATLVGEFTNVVLDLRFDAVMYERQHAKLTRFLQRRHIPPSIQNEAYRFFETTHRCQLAADQEILHALPTGLVLRIRRHMIGDTLQRVPIFQHAPVALLDAVLTRCFTRFAFEGDVLVHKGSIDATLFIVLRGQVSAVNDAGRVVTTLAAGAHFGELNLITKQSTWLIDYIANTFVDLCVLDSSTFQDILHLYPSQRSLIETIAAERLRQVQKGGVFKDAAIVERSLLNEYVGPNSKAPKNLVSNIRFSNVELRV